MPISACLHAHRVQGHRVHAHRVHGNAVESSIAVHKARRGNRGVRKRGGGKTEEAKTGERRRWRRTQE